MQQTREANVKRRQQNHEQEGEHHVADEGQEHVAHREERQDEEDHEEVGRDGLVAKSRLGRRGLGSRGSRCACLGGPTLI